MNEHVQNAMMKQPSEITHYWNEKILEGQIKYESFSIPFHVNCSKIDFHNAQSIDIQNLKIEFNFSALHLDVKDQKQLRNILIPHVPFFYELAQKELEYEMKTYNHCTKDV
ncbi:MAG: hypothetical protein IE909_13080 [Campylobacterales bacterium]|nr:hypothetical protein [Campylobacterales bacterium]